MTCERALISALYTLRKHHRICNLRYGIHGYGMSAYKGGDDKMQSFSMSCDSSISHSCFHKHVRLQYFVHNLNYKIQSKNPHHLQSAVPK